MAKKRVSQILEISRAFNLDPDSFLKPEAPKRKILMFYRLCQETPHSIEREEENSENIDDNWGAKINGPSANRFYELLHQQE